MSIHPTAQALAGAVLVAVGTALTRGRLDPALEPSAALIYIGAFLFGVAFEKYGLEKSRERLRRKEEALRSARPAVRAALTAHPEWSWHIGRQEMSCTGKDCDWKLPVGLNDSTAQAYKDHQLDELYKALTTTPEGGAR